MMEKNHQLLLLCAFAFTIAVLSTSYQTVIASFRLVQNKTVVVARNSTFLLGIFSIADDFKKRNTIRKTMLGQELPSESRDSLCTLNEFLNSTTNTSHCQIIYTFVIGGGKHERAHLDLHDPLTIDINETETDLTVLNVQENMNEGKTPSWFLFASTIMGSRIDYVSKLDSDTFISIPQLLSIIDNDLPSRNRNPNPKIYGGVLMDFVACGGRGKRRYRCLPIRGKFYMAGQFYFISHDIVQLTDLWTDPTIHPDEDINFGYRMWNIPASFTSIIYNTDMFWKHELKSCEQFEEYFEAVKNMSWKIVNETFLTI
jgi:hypothetical protein